MLLDARRWLDGPEAPAPQLTPSRATHRVVGCTRDAVLEGGTSQGRPEGGRCHWTAPGLYHLRGRAEYACTGKAQHCQQGPAWLLARLP